MSVPGDVCFYYLRKKSKFITMKKIITTLFSIIISLYAFSQNTYPATGDVTLGGNLVLTKPVMNSSILFLRSDWGIPLSIGQIGASLELLNGIPHPAASINFATTNSDNSISNRMIINNNGTVEIPGILQLSKADNSNPLITFYKSGWGTSAISQAGAILEISNQIAHDAAGISFSTKNKDQTITSKMTINNNGDIGIGTSQTDCKLTVAGDIHSRDVQVSVDAGADFVFAKEYDLKPLSELAIYIAAHKHLPEVASADEMKKKGMELGLMNLKLLQKVEELTLYMIDMNKKMDTMQLENKALKLKMEELAKSK